MLKATAYPQQHICASAASTASDTPTQLAAGVTLNAADALSGSQQTFTRSQVAYLIHLAYESGRTSSHRDDLAELACTWEDRREPRRTYEQRVAARHAEMAASGERRRRQPQPPTIPIDCEWPTVAVPGTVDITALRDVWICPCRRMPDGSHRYPTAAPWTTGLRSAA